MNGEPKARKGMMVDFMYQFHRITGCPDSWSNIIGRYVWDGVSRRDQHLNRRIRVEQMPAPPPHPQVWVGIIRSVEGPHTTKRWREFGFSLSDCKSRTCSGAFTVATPALQAIGL